MDLNAWRQVSSNSARLGQPLATCATPCERERWRGLPPPPEARPCCRAGRLRPGSRVAPGPDTTSARRQRVSVMCAGSTPRKHSCPVHIRLDKGCPPPVTIPRPLVVQHRVSRCVGRPRPALLPQLHRCARGAVRPLRLGVHGQHAGREAVRKRDCRRGRGTPALSHRHCSIVGNGGGSATPSTCK